MDNVAYRLSLAACLLVGLSCLPCPPAAAQIAPTAQGTANLGTIDHLTRDGRYQAAEDAAREALTNLEASGQGETLEAARYADRLVEALLQGGKGTRPESLARAKQAVEIKEHLFGPDALETGRSLDQLGRVHTRRGAFAEARQTLTRSLRVLQQAPGSQQTDVASAMQALGKLSCDQGQYDAASAQLREALAIQEAVLGPNTTIVATTLRVLGDCLQDRSDLIAAEELLRRALQIVEKALHANHSDIATALTSLGHVLTLNGKLEEAQTVLKRALAIYEEFVGPYSAMTAATLTRLGYLLTEMGDYSAAGPMLDRALELRIREYGARDLDTTETLYTLGILRGRMGDYRQAAMLFEQTVQAREGLLGSTHLSLARSLELWGVMLGMMERFSEAEPLMTRALAIRIAGLGPKNLAVANSLMNLATQVYEPTESYEKARNAAQQSLEILESTVDSYDFRIFYTLYSLTVAARGMGDLTAALQYSERALKIRERTFGPFHPHSVGMLNVRALLLAETGAYAAARTLALQAETIGREHVELMARTATESESLDYAATRAAPSDLLITLAEPRRDRHDRAAELAWDSVIRNRALVMDEMMARRRIAALTSIPEIAQLSRDWDHANQLLARLVVDGPGDRTPDEFNASLDAARNSKNRAERAFAARSADFRRTLALGHIGFSDVVALLPPDTALVAFVKYDHNRIEEAVNGKRQAVDVSDPSYAAFVLSSADANPRMVRLGDAATIEELLARWRQVVTREAFSDGRSSRLTEADYRNVAAKLRAVMWDPVAELLGDSLQVLVVPDGALNLVDLMALPVGETQYLAEIGPTIHYLSSERDLLMDARVSQSGQLLALGAPDFDGTELFASLRSEPVRLEMADTGTVGAVYRGPRSACGSFQSMSFEPLPAASQEVTEVLGLWRQEAGDEDNAIVLTGVAASETAFKQQATGKRVLHLATHGFFLGGGCGSALDPEESVGEVTNENPLLLSGLVLAGANHRDAARPDEDDGILTAQEIATLDLRDTEWAVLSACDTGTGEIRAGEGVFGLQRAFRMAGARTTIMSLWPVEDDAAREWMSALYRHHFTEGMSTMDSVHGASVDLLQRRRAQGLSTHPFYWAGFIASGDWR